MPEYTWNERQIIQAEALAWAARDCLNLIDIGGEFGERVVKCREMTLRLAQDLRDYNDQWEAGDDIG